MSSEVTYESPNEKRNRLWKPYYLYMVAIFYIFQGFYDIGQTLYIPFFLGGNGFTTSEISAMVTILAIPEFFKMFAGLLSDRLPIGKYGRRRPYIIIAGLAYLPVFGVIAFITEFSTLWTMLMILARIVWVFCDGILDALTVEITPDKYTGRVQGFGGGGKMFGTIVGALVIGAIAETSSWTIAVIVFGIGASLQALVAFVIKEPLYTRKSLTPIGTVFKRSLSKARPWFALILVMTMIGITGVYNVATAYSTKDLGYSPGTVSIVTAVFALAALIGSFIGGFLNDKLGVKKAIWVFGLLHWILLLPWLWVKPGISSTIVFIAATTMGISYSMLRIPIFSTAMQICEPEFEGFMFSAYTSFANIGTFIFGSLVVGQLTDIFPVGVSFYMLIPLMVIGILMMYLIKPSDKKPKAI